MNRVIIQIFYRFCREVDSPWCIRKKYTNQKCNDFSYTNLGYTIPI